MQRFIRLTAAWASGLVLLAAACGGGGDKDDGPITESEASAYVSRYFVTSLGLFTGGTDAQKFMELFAPECRQDVDPAAFAFLTLFVQAMAPELKDLRVDEADAGPLQLEHTEQGTLVSPRDPNALRVKVDGTFVSADEFFARSGFEATDDEELAEPLLLVKRDGKVYLGDCSELEGLTGGFS